MLTLSELLELKRETGLSNEDIAQVTGVPLSTVQKVFGGTVKAPRRKTLEALSEPLERIARGGAERDLPREIAEHHSGMLREEAFQYRATSSAAGRGPERSEPDRYGGRARGEGYGGYTLEDYYDWPEGERVELINGRIYAQASPNVDHQIVITQFLRQVLRCQEEHGEDCLVLPAPVDVQLDRDERTMVQPDVIIVCDESKNIGRCIYGAPDFVLEVLSDSSRRIDHVLKREKYCHAGCREYWIVDIEKQIVLVQDFEHDEYDLRYSFDDMIPIRISDGKCVIDFADIRARLTRHA